MMQKLEIAPFKERLQINYRAIYRHNNCHRNEIENHHKIIHSLIDPHRQQHERWKPNNKRHIYTTAL